MASSRGLKSVLVALLGLLAIAVFLRLGVQQQLLKWTVQAYLGKLLHSHVRIEELRGGFFSGITLRNTAVYSKSVPTPILTIDEIITDFRVLGGLPVAKHCVLTRARFYWEECVASLGEFSFPLDRSVVLLPRSDFWRKASFSLFNSAIYQSANRQDNVLLRDLTGSATPAKNQTLEFLLETAPSSAQENRLQIYGTINTQKESTNADFQLNLSRLEKLNLFLRSFHVLQGTAVLEGKIRSGLLESAQLDFRGVNLLFSMDKRVWKNMQGRIAVNGQFVSLRDGSAESQGLHVEMSGDAQRVAFGDGRVDIPHLVAKAKISAEHLSSRPVALNFQSSVTVFYRHPRNVSRLQWNRDVVESLSLFEGKLTVNGFMDLEFQAKYTPGQPFVLDYKVTSLDFEKVKSDWFGNKFGSLFGDVRILGEGRAECRWDAIALAGIWAWDDAKIAYRFVWEVRQLRVEDFRIDDATTLLGTVDLDKRDKSELIFHFQDESITRLMTALGSVGKTSLTGKFTGTVGLRGNLLDPLIAGELDVRNGMLKGIPFKQGQVNLNGRFPKIYLDRSVLYVQKNMPVELKGFIDLTQKDMFQNVRSEMKPVMDKVAP